MPKTIAITPSWYWPARVPRVVGVPPFGVHELLVDRRARRDPDGVALADAGSRLTNAELAARVAERAGSYAQGAAVPGAELAALDAAAPGVDGAVVLLAALAAGTVVRVGGGGGAAAVATGERRTGRTDPVLGYAAGDTVAWHSHRSLVAGALSLATFWGPDAGRPWVSTLPLHSWDGVTALLAALATGAAVVLSEPGEPALGAIARESAGFCSTDLESAFGATKEAKREVKSVRGVLGGLALVTPGPFDPDRRRRVGKLFECPALTLFGRPETGPIFAAHPSWYIDEAMGIPCTNVHVVPVDPRNGVPLATMWELVELAAVTVWSPMCMVGYEGGAHPERFRDGRFVTGVQASSDANGMIYVLPD